MIVQIPAQDGSVVTVGPGADRVVPNPPIPESIN